MNGGGGAIANSIIYDNADWDFDSNSNELNDITFTCSPGLTNGTGVGNITNAPRFKDADNSDFRLRTSSPCIDGGTTNVQSEYTVDIEGQPHFDFNRDGIREPDMGCYETPPPDGSLIMISATEPAPKTTRSFADPLPLVGLCLGARNSAFLP